MNTKTFFRREINSDISSSRSKKIVSDLSAPSAPDHNSGNTNGLQVGTPKTMCPRSSAPDSVGSFSQDRQDIGARHLIAHTNFTIYPFTTSDLALLVWADWHHPPAAAAIVAAENKATDDPSYRDKANAYIRDCLAAIRRRQECVEKADDMLWGFAMQEKWKRDRMSCKDGYGGQDFDNVENFDRAFHIRSQPRVMEAPKTTPEASRSNAQARKLDSGIGLFGTATDAAECRA